MLKMDENRRSFSKMYKVTFQTLFRPQNRSWNILEGESKRLREGIHVEQAGRNFVDVAPDDLPYARVQQLGGKAGRGGAATIPARPYLVLQQKDETEIEEIIVDFILGGNR